MVSRSLTWGDKGLIFTQFSRLHIHPVGSSKFQSTFTSREGTVIIQAGRLLPLTFSALSAAAPPCSSCFTKKPVIPHCVIATPFSCFIWVTAADHLRLNSGKISLPSIHSLSPPQLGQVYFLHTSIEPWYHTPVLGGDGQRDRCMSLSTGIWQECNACLLISRDLWKQGTHSKLTTTESQS